MGMSSKTNAQQCSYLQEFCGGLGQVAGQEFKVLLVKAAFKMSVHIFFVE